MTTQLQGASFHRGTSKQDYRTPDDFRMAVRQRFGFPHFDLAADATNAFSSSFGYFSEADNSLVQSWDFGGRLLWLNPPFGNIAPWAEKCAQEANLGAKILFLVPASVGSNWFQTWVHECARVYFLNPRLCFDGKNPFPKDMLLAHYDGVIGYECWRWK